jgi:hypothetical protein
MTNEQFYILVGVPVLGILLNALVFLSLNARMTTVENRMAAIELRMSNFENTFTTRFDLLMGRLTDLEREIRDK